MSFAFPQFTDRVPLDGNRSWTAEFDSYDQRNDDCYYRVILHDGEVEVARIMVQLGLASVGDDSSPEFVGQLRKEIGRVAARGKSNTDYEGSLASWLTKSGRD